MCELQLGFYHICVFYVYVSACCVYGLYTVYIMCLIYTRFYLYNKDVIQIVKIKDKTKKKCNLKFK